MKTKTYIIVFLVPYILFSQSLEPTQQTFNYYSLSQDITITNALLNPDNIDFKQDSIIIGYQWNSGRRISDGLLFSQDDIDPRSLGPQDVEKVVWASDMFIRLYNTTTPVISISSHAGEESVMNARGFTYAPYYLIDENNINNFTPDSEDPLNPVWGFRTIHGEPFEDQTTHRKYLQLDNNDKSLSTPVLESPWPSNHLSYSHPGDYNDEMIDNQYMGYSFYISINLKKDGLCNLDGLSGDNVLKVEMPYWLSDDTEYFIRFFQIPSTTTVLNTARGKIRGLIESPGGPSYFYITKDMIPEYNEQDPYITINAYFYCDNGEFRNPRIQRYPERLNTEDTDWIHDLGIKITYLGKCPISIAWVRIMTPNCKRLLEGGENGWDNIIISNVQSALDRYGSATYNSRHIRPFRFNNVVEGHTQNWIAERYFNKLVGSLGTGEDASLYPDRYEYYVKPADRWIGYYKIPANVSVPYSRQVYGYTNQELISTVGTFNGYMGIRGDGGDTRDLETNPAISHYETYLAHFYDALPISYFLNHDDLPKYEQAINWGNNYGRASYQALHENMLYHSFLSSKCQGLLFSDKFWWGQIFNLTKVQESVSPTYFTEHRPFTGEELRLSMWTPIILGAKGLIYDGVGSEFAFSVEKK